MLPLWDGMRARRFPIVTVALIAANLAVWFLYELPNVDAAVAHGSFYACSVDNTCRAPEPWAISWFTAMFMHASWDHILGNMLFLAVFGKSVEDAFGRLRYLAFYVAGGFAATATQAATTLLFGSAADERVATLGASGAIAAVMGAFFVLYPSARITSLLLVFRVHVPAAIYLGLWFALQLYQAHYAIVTPQRGASGVAFAAHIGGFVFGALTAGALRHAGRIGTRGSSQPPALAFSHQIRDSSFNSEQLAWRSRR